MQKEFLFCSVLGNKLLSQEAPNLKKMCNVFYNSYDHVISQLTDSKIAS